MSKRIIILIVLFSLGLVTLSLYIISTLDPGEKPHPSSEVINVSSRDLKVTDDFNLKDHYGELFNLERLKKKFTILYFGFAHCPDFCEDALAKIEEVMKKLSPEQKEKIQVVFVSVDPERDDITTLKQFVEKFDKDTIGVTGDKHEIEKLANSVKAYFSQIKNEQNGDDYYVDHSAFIYFLNPMAELIAQFTPNAAIDEVADQLRIKLVSE